MGRVGHAEREKKNSSGKGNMTMSQGSKLRRSFCFADPPFHLEIHPEARWETENAYQKCKYKQQGLALGLNTLETRE